MAVPKRKTSKARKNKRRSSVWKLSAPGMTKCPKCGADLPENAKFCLNCGERIPVEAGMVICPNCGKSVPKAKFCPECGHKFGNSCPNCGASLADGAKFCMECGTKL